MAFKKLIVRAKKLKIYQAYSLVILKVECEKQPAWRFAE